jgi:hypothetical protein
LEELRQLQRAVRERDEAAEGRREQSLSQTLRSGTRKVGALVLPERLHASVAGAGWWLAGAGRQRAWGAADHLRGCVAPRARRRGRA